MLEIAPFRGIRYDLSKVRMEDVVAPPYDVIGPELQNRLYDRSPYNVVRLILGREEDRYGSAARAFQQWQAEGILKPDGATSLYLLHQTFDTPDGLSVTRKGFIARCKLVEFSENVILPHEKTHAGPREDRLRLFKATKSNFSQIFCLYADPEKEVDRAVNGWSKAAPAIDVIYEGVQNRLWPVADHAVISAVQNFMASRQALIADGHHRYETALAYRDLMKTSNPHHTGSESYNFMMMFFTNVDDTGLVIYPTHRIVHSLPSIDIDGFLSRAAEHFIVRPYDQDAALQAGLQSSAGPSFGLLSAGRSGGILLSLKPARSPGDVILDSLPAEVKELDVSILHRVILRDLLGISIEAQEAKRNLEYVRDAGEAIDAVRNGKGQLAFLMNATKIQQVRRVAKAGHTMPQKSTYFYPKLLSGLVINSLSDDAV